MGRAILYYSREFKHTKVLTCQPRGFPNVSMPLHVGKFSDLNLKILEHPIHLVWTFELQLPSQFHKVLFLALRMSILATDKWFAEVFLDCLKKLYVKRPINGEYGQQGYTITYGTFMYNFLPFFNMLPW